MSGPVLTCLSAQLATLALKVPQPEAFAATVLGFFSLIALTPGIAIRAVTADPLCGQARFGFGKPKTKSGIFFVVMSTGFFAIGKVRGPARQQSPPRETGGKPVRLSFRDILGVRVASLRGWAA